MMSRTKNLKSVEKRAPCSMQQQTQQFAEKLPSYRHEANQRSEM